MPSRMPSRPAQDYFGNMTAGDSEALTTTTTTTTTLPRTILINRESNDISVEGKSLHKIILTYMPELPGVFDGSFVSISLTSVLNTDTVG